MSIVILRVRLGLKEINVVIVLSSEVIEAPLCMCACVCVCLLQHAEFVSIELLV